MRRLFAIRGFLLLGAALALFPSTVRAEWGLNGNPVCIAQGSRSSPQAVPDGQGGAIVTFQDMRPSNYSYVWASRISEAGDPLWGLSGIYILGRSAHQTIADGFGGAIVMAWSNTIPQIHVSRIDSSGATLWGAGGVAVIINTFYVNSTPLIVSDNAGGCIVFWRDTRSGCYANRVDAAGNVLWGTTGMLIQATNAAYRAISDLSGGAIVTFPNSTTYNYITAIRINGAGSVVWPSRTVFSMVIGAAWPVIVSDRLGGMYLAGNGYINRVRSDGTLVLQAPGRSFLLGTATNYPTSIVAYATGTANIQMDNLYVAKIDSSLSDVWGVARAIFEYLPSGSDGRVYSAGGDALGRQCFVYTTSVAGSDRVRAFATQLDANGDHVSGVRERLLATASGLTGLVGIDNGEGRTLAFWSDTRNGASCIYAQLVQSTGPSPDQAPLITRIRDVPADEGGRVTLDWARSAYDTPYMPEIDHYALWRQRAFGGKSSLPGGELGAGGFSATAYGEAALAAAGWEWLQDIPAQGFDHYTATVSTLADSTSAGRAFHRFLVSAIRNDDDGFYSSQVDSGYSVDNIAPLPISMFVGSADHVTDGVLLNWARCRSADLSFYEVLRSNEAAKLGGRDIAALGRATEWIMIAAVTDTTFLDSNRGIYDKYSYLVNAVDVHGNRGEGIILRANEISGTGSGNVPAAVWLGPAAPNPFNAGVSIRFSLPLAGRAVLAVFNVSGARIATLFDGIASVGEHRVEWQGLDANGQSVASGVYFARLETDADVQTVKLTLAK